MISSTTILVFIYQLWQQHHLNFQLFFGTCHEFAQYLVLYKPLGLCRFASSSQWYYRSPIPEITGIDLRPFSRVFLGVVRIIIIILDEFRK